MLKRFFSFLIILGVLSVAGLAVAATETTATTHVKSAVMHKTLIVNVDHGTSLTLKEPAASVFIANPDIADVQVMSSTTIMIFGKRTGETTFMATDSAGETLDSRTIVVTQDLSSLRRDLDLAIPGNKIHVAALPNGLVLTGDAKDAATVTDAQKLATRYLSAGGDIVNRIHVSGSNQIQIRVRFAEMQRSINNTLGFNWSNLASIGGMTFGIATGATGLGTGAGILSSRPANAGLNLPNDAIGFGRNGKHFSVNGLIDALAQDGLVTILAEPNLTAMSGETANFLAGGEVPLLIPQGNNTFSVQYKPYGISLAFTPTLINDDRISLHVKPEVSELSSVGAVSINTNSLPAFTTRRAETTVEVASGQSFAIAGLMDNEQTQNVDKYPMLGDMPIIGALFRSDNFKNGQTELVIIITPYIVKPSSDKQLALPMDGLAPPTEKERLGDLRYSSSDPNARPQSGEPVAVRDEPVTEMAPLTPVMPAPVSASETVLTPPVPPALAAPLTPTLDMQPKSTINHSNINRALQPASEKAMPAAASPVVTPPANLNGFILE